MIREIWLVAAVVTALTAPAWAQDQCMHGPLMMRHGNQQCHTPCSKLYPQVFEIETTPCQSILRCLAARKLEGSRPLICSPSVSKLSHPQGTKYSLMIRDRVFIGSRDAIVD